MTKISGIATSLGIGAVPYDSIVEIEKGDGTSAKSTTAVLGVASGTSFPGSPTTGDRFYRSDRHIPYFYDGTRWLSVQLFTHEVAQQDALNPLTATKGRDAANPGAMMGYDIYVEKFYVATLQTVGSTASNYYTFQLTSVAGASSSNVGGTTSSQNDTLNQWSGHSVTVNAVVASSQFGLEVVSTKTGTATIYVAPSLSYRLVG